MKIMIKTILCLIGVSLDAVAAFAQTTAFVGVNVIPMDRERVLQNQTVIVRDGLIAEIGNVKKIKVPRDARKIDATGKYLTPGLIDAHVHLRQTNEKGLIRYLSAGVTTARDMNGRPALLEWRERIKQRKLLGPTLYVASPSIGNFSSPRDGYPTPKTPDEADALVKRFVTEGYDWIKVYSFVPRDIYFALLDAANKYKIPIGGHPQLEITFEESLRMKSIEHLLGYLDPLMTPAATELDKQDLRGVFHAVEFDETKLPDLAKRTRQAGTWNCPTILFFDHRVPTEQVRKSWDQPELRKLGHLNRTKIVRALHQADAKLLVCTDSDAGRNLEAKAIYEELLNMQESGLAPYDVLAAATRNAAEFLSSNEFGTVGVGKRADLLLIECDPLKDLSCVAKQTGVMTRGQWITRQEFATLLETK